MDRSKFASQLASSGHGLVNDNWSAWWLACNWSRDIGHADADLVDAGATRIEANRRPTLKQLAAANRVWRAAIDTLRTPAPTR